MHHGLFGLNKNRKGKCLFLYTRSNSQQQEEKTYDAAALSVTVWHMGWTFAIILCFLTSWHGYPSTDMVLSFFHPVCRGDAKGWCHHRVSSSGVLSALHETRVYSAEESTLSLLVNSSSIICPVHWGLWINPPLTLWFPSDQRSYQFWVVCENYNIEGGKEQNLASSLWVFSVASHRVRVAAQHTVAGSVR